MNAIRVRSRQDMSDLGDLPYNLVYVVDEARYYVRERGVWLQAVWMVSSLNDPPALYSTPVLANRARDDIGGSVHRMLVETRVES